MKLGSSRGMDTKRPRGSERSKPCHELQLTRRSQPPYPWPPEQAQPGVSKPCRTTVARILLKADVSEAGEGWSDSAISVALDTSIYNIGRTRRRLVEEGIAAALTRKYNPNSARPRIFDGAAEAKLIALTCSPAPEGLARWSLREP